MPFHWQAVLKAKLVLTAIHSDEQRGADAFTYAWWEAVHECRISDLFLAASGLLKDDLNSGD